MYVSLDNFIDYEKLNDLNNYLNQINIYNFNCVNFVANNKKHGNAIQLTDTINWDPKFGFRESRLYRGNPHYNKLNENSVVLHKLTKFIYDLPFFEHIGCICIILNEPNVEGSEHCDHMFDDIVSEFVWLRTENKKNFLSEIIKVTSIILIIIVFGLMIILCIILHLFLNRVLVLELMGNLMINFVIILLIKINLKNLYSNKFY